MEIGCKRSYYLVQAVYQLPFNYDTNKSKHDMILKFQWNIVYYEYSYTLHMGKK